MMVMCPHRGVPFEVHDTTCFAVLCSYSTRRKSSQGNVVRAAHVLLLFCPLFPQRDGELQERGMRLGLNGYYASEVTCSYCHSVLL